MIRHTTVRISSTSMANVSPPLWKCGTSIDEFCGCPFQLLCISCMSGLNPREDDAKFFELWKRAEGGPSRAGSRSKTFPEVPIIFHVSCGNPESRQGIVLGLGKVKG